MRETQKIMESNNNMHKSISITIDSLIDQIENRGLSQGSALTEGFAEIEINGVLYQMQMRLESNQKAFIAPDESFESESLGVSSSN